MTDCTAGTYRDELDDLPPETHCSCYDPVSMEYGPNYPCTHCQKGQPR